MQYAWDTSFASVKNSCKSLKLKDSAMKEGLVNIPNNMKEIVKIIVILHSKSVLFYIWHIIRCLNGKPFTTNSILAQKHYWILL